MKLTDYLKVDYVRVGLNAATKPELLEAMVQLVAHHPGVENVDALRQAILEREKIMSTGVGKGFAIPHGKTDSVDEIVLAFAVCAAPVEYESMDGEPVRLVLLLVSRDNLVGQRLKLLSRASKVMNNEAARFAMLNATTAEEVLAIFQFEEDRMAD